VPSARSIVNRWVDSSRSVAELDDCLLEVKAHEVELRDDQNELRMKWTKRGFKLLLLSLVTALLVAAANAVSPLWSDQHDQERIETPAQSEAVVSP
jgi:hypothetical protein